MSEVPLYWTGPPYTPHPESYIGLLQGATGVVFLKSEEPLYWTASPYTTHPESWTADTPCTLHPTTYTLHCKLSTRIPTP